jgi:bifunctional oligoribonuclease and PAP phosphatase NrnA
MWDRVKTLKSALLGLPEPILILGNRMPDGDSLGSAAAVLDYLRYEGYEAYIHCVLPPPPTLSWMLDEGDEATAETLEEYASLVVVDDQVNSERLGFEFRKVPTICIDHHMTGFPDDVADSIAKKGSLGAPTVVVNDNVINFWKLCPATACILIDEEIFHPFLWVSLYTDSVGFTVNTSTVIRYASILTEASDISDEDAEGYIKKVYPTAPVSILESFAEATIYTLTGTHNGEQLQIAMAIADAQDDLSYRKILWILRQFGHVACFVNSVTGKASVRSDRYEYSALDIAKKFGGGGHVRAAGFQLNTKEFGSQCDKLITLLGSDLESVRLRMLM